MRDSRTFAARAAGALFAVAVAALAAALAHLAIDIAGDYLLPHDAYDDVAHDSRTVVAAAAAAMLLAGAARSLYTSVLAALGRGGAPAAAIHVGAPLAFIGAVTALAVPLLLTMETVDAFAARRDVDDLGDLFGGSILLGLGTTLAVAMLVAAIAYVVLRFFVHARAAVARALGGRFQPRERVSLHAFTTRAQRRCLAIARPAPTRYVAKRGPPTRR
jgi:hypothetical protein